VILTAIWFIPLNWPLFWLAVLSYGLRLWGMEAVYHRYFSHRAFKAGRTMQFILALIGSQTGQRGPLWWGSKHRDHHKYVETEQDPHSPVAHSFLTAYVNWFKTPEHAAVDLDAIADFARYPELRWLDRFYLVPFFAGAALLFGAGHVGLLGSQIDGVAALLWGYYVPTVGVLHTTSLINTICHMPGFPGGYRRFDCKDHSVNRPLLAMLTMGTAFHNNHHRYAAAARAGFAWYEFDLVYYILRLMQTLGLVRDVKSTIPVEILKEGGINRNPVA
jgi:stearoyl-CoA desaturase (delta-9 desaturase)